MQETAVHNNSFDEIIRRKLADYSLPVDDFSWNEIEGRLNDTKPHKVVGLPWIAGMAAACAALFFLLFPWNNNTIEREMSVQLSEYEEPAPEKAPEQEITAPLLSSIEEKHNTAVRKRKENPTDTSSVKVFERVAVREEEKNTAEEDPDIQTVITKELDKKLLAYNDEPLQMTGRHFSNTKTRSVNFYMGSCNGTYLMNDNRNDASSEYAPDKINNGIMATAPEDVKEAILMSNDFSDITHYAPVSLGASFRKELDPVFALETGLVYTFLSSKFKNENPKRDAVLQLHYLGIPVNLQAQFYRNKHKTWKMYVSLGTMLEKGFLVHYSQNEYYFNNVVNTSFDDKIEGWQWSLHASLGADYRIYKNYSLYIEPKVSYYLENNQPVSARTENPLTIGINLGIRYNW